METVSENACFGGVQGVYTHKSEACQCDMTFGLFLPEEAKSSEVPMLWYLSGLTCTHENAMTKAGAQAWAAEQGIALVFPDTSPRGDHVADVLALIEGLERHPHDGALAHHRTTRVAGVDRGVDLPGQEPALALGVGRHGDA